MKKVAKYTEKCSAYVEPSIKDDLRKISEEMFSPESHIIRQALREFIERYKAREESIQDFHNTPVTFHKESKDV